jgi:hypothetical protein
MFDSNLIQNNFFYQTGERNLDWRAYNLFTLLQACALRPFGWLISAYLDFF